MKIRYLQGPKAGTEEHVQNETGRVVVGAGLAEQIGPEDGPGLNPADYVSVPGSGLVPLPHPKPGDYIPAAPRWEVKIVGESMKILVIKMTISDTFVCYSGDPDKANARKEWEGGGRFLNGFGREIPAPILKEYKKRWKNNPELRGVNFVTKVVAPPIDNHGFSRDVFIE